MTVVKIKKQKTQKSVSKKENLNLKIIKLLKATKFKNDINYLEKNKIVIDSFFSCKRKHKELTKNNKLRLKTQQTFKNERENVFTEEINKIALGPNDDKRIQSIDLIETYAYRTSKDLISEKKEIKCNNIITLYKR